jgi:tetratricopeptide (TPR) repeat protein
MEKSVSMKILAMTMLFLFIYQPVMSQSQSQENLLAMIKRLSAMNDIGELDNLIADLENEAGSSNATAETYLQLGVLLSFKSYFSSDKADRNTYLRKGHQYIHRALELSPNLATAHSIMGFHYLYAYLKDGKALSKAKAHFQKALELDPNEPIALDGMHRLALRASPVSQKEQYIKEKLVLLSKATRSGRKYSILSAKFNDSIQSLDFAMDIQVEDVSKDTLVEFIRVMKLMRKENNVTLAPSVSAETLSSVIKMIGEVTGLTYGDMMVYNIELNRIVVVLHVPDEGPICRICTPFEMFKKYYQKQITSRQFFNSLTYTSN